MYDIIFNEKEKNMVLSNLTLPFSGYFTCIAHNNTPLFDKNVQKKKLFNFNYNLNKSLIFCVKAFRGFHLVLIKNRYNNVYTNNFMMEGILFK